MNVTVIADASHCPDTGAAGCAFWIACTRGKHGFSFSMPKRCKSSQIAELQALVTGLWHGIQHGVILAGDAVLMQTDCQGAIAALDGTRTRLEEQECEAVALYNQLKQDFNLTTELRHVKGHSKEEGARFAANKYCDRNARKRMREARAILGKVE